MYVTLDDLLGQVDRNKLIQWTNDPTDPQTDADGNPIIVQAVLDEAFENTAAEIDVYVGSRYPLPLDPVPKIIGKVAVDIAIYNLYSRQWGVQEEDVFYQRYKNAIKLLEKIAKGDVQIGAPPTTPTIGGVSFSSRPKVFGDRFSREYD